MTLTITELHTRYAAAPESSIAYRRVYFRRDKTWKLHGCKVLIHERATVHKRPFFIGAASMDDERKFGVGRDFATLMEAVLYLSLMA